MTANSADRGGPERRRYRWVEDEFAPGGRRRVLVREHLGVEGFEVRWSQHCTGCCDYGEYEPAPERGSGCEECGYTGRRRRSAFIPFNYAEYDRALSPSSPTGTA